MYPATLGEILRLSVTLYVTNAPAVIGLILLIWLPVELSVSYYDYFLADPENIGGSFRTSLWIENLIGIIPIAGVIAIGNAAMKGERPSLWFGLRAGLEAWPRMVGTRIVVGFITLLALVLFIVPAIYVGVRSALSEPVAVIERVNPMLSMQRSFELTKGNFWRFFALLVTAVGLLILLGVLTGLPVEFFPEFDHWLLTAGLALLLDLFAGWTALLFVAAYWAAARPGLAKHEESTTSEV